MRKYRPPPKIKRSSTECGDALVRQFVASMGTVSATEVALDFTVGHLRLWLHDPDRGMTPPNLFKLARGVNLPVEAILFRWTPIKDLDMWRWVNRFEQDRRR